METIKEVLEKIKFIESQCDKYFKRLEEINIIEAGCEVLGKSFAFYRMERQIIQSQIKFLEKDIKELREKEIVGLNGEVK